LGWLLALVGYFGAVAGAMLSPALAYWLVGRGYAASRALRIATIFSAIMLLVAVAPLALLILGLAGVAGVAGIVLAVLFFLAQYLLGPYLVLWGLQLRRPGRGEEWLLESLERLKRRVGYRGRVDLYIAGDPVPNAFAVSSPLKRAIVVNEGLLRILDRGEVEAVLSHELGHIVHRDSSYLVATSLAPSLVYLLGIAMLIGGIVAVKASTLMASTAAETARSEEEAGAAAATALGGMLIGLAMALMGAALAALSFIVNLAVLGFSRIREHLADAFSVKATRSLKIVSALEKIEAAIARARELEPQRETALTPKLRNTLYIVPRLYATLYAATHGLTPSPLEWLSPLSTHPPLQARAYIAERVYQELARTA
jgi:heat shock protein HtpX